MKFSRALPGRAPDSGRERLRRRPARPVGRGLWWSPSFERLENRCVLSTLMPFTVGVATLPVDPSVQVSGTITQAGGQQLYRVTLDTQGVLVADVQNSANNTLVSLEDARGHTLIQGEAISPTNPDERIAQHLPAGNYVLAVSDSTSLGDFSLSTTFTPALPPGQAINETQGSYGVTTADLNGDGKPDLIVPDYDQNQILVNDGVGDGTFQPPVAIPVGVGPRDVLATRLFGDGPTDLVVVDQLSNDLTILKGDGRGNFTVAQVLATRPGPVEVVAGDFSGDGRLDLAVADGTANGVEIFRNQGDGSFATTSSWISSIDSPSSLTVANLNGDGKPDLAVASSSTGNLVMLMGQGQDQFHLSPNLLPVGPGVSDVIAANFSGSGSGLSDLAAVSPISGMVSIFHDDGFNYRLADRFGAGTSPQALVAGDFSGDGKLDLAVANYGSNNVSIFFGAGSDQFGASKTIDAGDGPVALAAVDLNGDGKLDLVDSDLLGLTVSVMLNNGDASFITPPPQPSSAGPTGVVVADLTGNGIDDLIVPDSGLNVVEVFLGRGDGTFRDPILVPAGSGPEGVAVGDFTGDGVVDLAVVDFFTNSLLILKGNGDGTFDPIQTLTTGDGPEFIKTADLDGDGHLDLVVADYLGNDINLFYGRGDGSFANAVRIPVGIGPSGIAISDLNGDGRPDIAVSDSGSNDLRIFIAQGPRTYAAPIAIPAGDQPRSVTAGDFNNDGHPDLIVADGLSSPSVVTLLRNNGDGTFQAPVTFGVGGDPSVLAVGDFTGNGHLDVVTGNDGSNNLSLLMGRGDGTFAPAVSLPSGTDPYGVAVGDFNGDGHLDIVSVNDQSSDLTVLLGQGDGTFASPATIPLISPDLPTISAELEGNSVPQVLVANPETGTISIFNSQGDGTLQLINTIDVGGSPSGLVVGDFNGDGRPDLAVTDSSTGEVLILLGLGNGTFQSPTRYAVGKSPRSPIVGDFTHDGRLDIAVADTGSDEVSILLGRGDGTFEPAREVPVGREPIELVIGGIDAQGDYELGTVNRSSNDLSLLLGQPDGNFVSFNYSLPGITTTEVVTGDFDGNGASDVIFVDQMTGIAYVELQYAQALATRNGAPIVLNLGLAPGNYRVQSAALDGNGQSDLILANISTGVVTILGDWSGNHFQSRTSFHVNATIAAISVVDLNGDGRPDILITDAGTGNVETYLSGGNGIFSAAESTVPLPHPLPLIFPQGHPGVSNIVTVNNSGQVLERFGIAGVTGQYSSPVNLTLGTGDAIRDYAVVRTGGVTDVALLLTNSPTIFMQSTVNVTASGRYPIPLPGEGNYTRLVSGDLFGTGRDDLIVINRTLNEILIYEQTSPGVFEKYGQPIPAGFGPTDVTLAQLTPGGLPDLVVADGSSGTVTLIGRDSQGGFQVAATLPAGLATAGTVLLSNGLNRTSPDEPVGVISAIFSPSGLADVVVVDHGTDRISILKGLAGGGLAAPSLDSTYSTGLDPIQVIAAPLTSDGLLDLVVLNEGSHDLSIFLNNGHGGFTVMPRVDAGDNPTAISVRDVTGDGVPDVVVSNASGDILTLAGNGDGSFQPYERADGTVSLAVGDLTGTGQNDFVLSNTSQDLLSVQTSTSAAGFLQGRGNGLLAPGPVAIADMNGDGIPDLIVTNTGGNDVLVYLGLGNGQFAAPQEFFTGTAPVGLTVADLTGNGKPDLIVANSGSNDVTILLGTDVDGQWTMVPGPRLKAGDHPVSTTVADLYGNGEQDILVVNQDSDSVTVLRGLGGGFFNDNTPLTLPTGRSPVQAFVGHFTNSSLPGIVVLDSLSNDMTFYANVNTDALRIPSGGVDPVAGVVGDFKNHGYTDLAVANNGDSRITLFEGGPNGLTLAQTILLGAATHPTDLVVSATNGGGLQFYVGAAGQNHAIAVSLTVVATIEVIVSAPIDSGLTSSGGLTRSSSDSSFHSSPFHFDLFEQPGNVTGTQTQESATVAASSGGSTTGFASAAAIVTTLTQAIQPLFSPSSRTLGWLIDNLVQLAQGQTAEILPIGKNEMAAVAVLLSNSSIATSAEDMVRAPLPVPTEDETPIASSLADVAGLPAPSNLDRFVANLGVADVDFSRELIARPGQVPEFGPEWVWHRRPTDPSAITATFDQGREEGLSSRRADPAIELALDSDRGWFGLGDDEADRSGVGGFWSVSRIALAVGSALTLAIGVIFARRLDWPALANFRRAGGRSNRRAPGAGITLEGRRPGSGGSSLKPRNSEDLPPWLQGPPSPKVRRHSPDRSFAASLFRKWNRAESEEDRTSSITPR